MGNDTSSYARFFGDCRGDGCPGAASPQLNMDGSGDKLDSTKPRVLGGKQVHRPATGGTPRRDQDPFSPN